MYLAWMFHNARSVTDRSCLVCHDRSPAPHLMLPMGKLSECLTDPYSVEFLCPTVCLFGALSVLILAQCGCIMLARACFNPCPLRCRLLSPFDRLYPCSSRYASALFLVYTPWEICPPAVMSPCSLMTCRLIPSLFVTLPRALTP